MSDAEATARIKIRHPVEELGSHLFAGRDAAAGMHLEPENSLKMIDDVDKITNPLQPPFMQGSRAPRERVPPQKIATPRH